MTLSEFLKLQIMMYVSDSKLPVDKLVCSDFYLITEFKGKKMKLQRLEPNGQPDGRPAFWVEYSDIDLTQKMYPSEFRKQIAIG